MALMYFVGFVGALVFSFILTRTVRQVAVRRGWVVAPLSNRHIHRTPIPRLGGVAIYLAFVIQTLGMLGAAEYFNFDLGLSPRTIFFVLAAGTMIFLLGLYDDFRPLKPIVKIAVQVVAATLLFFQGFRVINVPFLPGEEYSTWVALPLTILWVLLITNAFNLIDGLDGLAAGSALFSTIAVFVACFLNANLQAALLMVTLAGAILGFLRFNFNPATIFLGDGGSLFIGFMLSAFALVGSQKKPTLVAVAIPIVSFGLPILETAISIFRRFLNGQPIFSADREHIHHKLMERGLSQRQAVVILYGVSAGCGLLSLFLATPGGGAVGIVLFILGLGVWIGVQRLGYHEFFELGRVAQRTIEQKQVIINNLAIRRTSVELSKAKSYDEIHQVLQRTFATNDFDGFSLKVLPAVTETLFGLQQAEPQVYEWSKPDEDGEKDLSAAWALKLELFSAQKQLLGEFAAYRAYSDKACLVDVNLLVSVFQTALSEALSRLQTAEQEVVTLAKPAARHSGVLSVAGIEAGKAAASFEFERA